MVAVLGLTGRRLNRARTAAARDAARSVVMWPRYRDFLEAGDRLLDLAVWPQDVTEVPEQAAPLVEAMRQRGIGIARSSTAQVSQAANTAVVLATQLADIIKDLRLATVRGPHGAIDDTVVERYTHAHQSLSDAIDQATATNAPRHAHPRLVPAAPTGQIR